jgi:hypothetical protein
MGFKLNLSGIGKRVGLGVGSTFLDLGKGFLSKIKEFWDNNMKRN